MLSYGVPARGNVRTRRLCSCCSALRAFCRYASVFADTSIVGPLSTSSGRRSSCEPKPARGKIVRGQRCVRARAGRGGLPALNSRWRGTRVPEERGAAGGPWVPKGGQGRSPLDTSASPTEAVARGAEPGSRYAAPGSSGGVVGAIPLACRGAGRPGPDCKPVGEGQATPPSAVRRGGALLPPAKSPLSTDNSGRLRVEPAPYRGIWYHSATVP